MLDAFIVSFGDIGLWGIFLLMTMESSLFPVPSEVVMIPAGIIAAQGGYPIWLAILIGGL